MILPLRLGVLRLTYHPVAQIVAEATDMDRLGYDSLWLAEAYPWWRSQGGLEPRSATAISAIVADRTSRLTVGWGIISPYARHPLQIAAEARVTQEVAGPGRFLLGLGASKILMNGIGVGESAPARPLAAIRETVGIVRSMLAGDSVDVHGRQFTAVAPAMSAGTDASRQPVPIYLGATGPRLQELAGEIGDGLLAPSLSTPRFIDYARRNVARGAAAAGRDPSLIDVGATLIACVDEHDRERALQGVRETAGMYLANKVQNIRGAADVLLDAAGLTRAELQPVAEAARRYGRRTAGAAVTDSMLERVRPIAGTPKECIEALEEYVAAGCSHVMLEFGGQDHRRQLDLFGRLVLPHVR